MFASPWKDGLIVLVIVLLFFGPKRLPALSRSIGESIKEFKGGIAEGAAPDEDSAQLNASQSAPVASPARETAETGSERSA
jgi:sec-independent protein translocase protein TatA